MLILAGAFAGLVFDLHCKHNPVFAKHEMAWTPIICFALMVLARGLGLARWEQSGWQMLTIMFVAGFVIGVLGVLGFWFCIPQHSKGHPVGALAQMLSAGTVSHPNPVKSPPLLAPLAFLGFGFLGVLACSRHFTSSADLPLSVHKMQGYGFDCVAAAASSWRRCHCRALWRLCSSTRSPSPPSSSAA